MGFSLINHRLEGALARCWAPEAIDSASFHRASEGGWKGTELCWVSIPFLPLVQRFFCGSRSVLRMMDRGAILKEVRIGVRFLPFRDLFPRLWNPREPIYSEIFGPWLKGAGNGEIYNVCFPPLFAECWEEIGFGQFCDPSFMVIFIGDVFQYACMISRGLWKSSVLGNNFDWEVGMLCTREFCRKLYPSANPWESSINFRNYFN